MNKKVDLSKEALIGKWRLVGIQTNTYNRGWENEPLEESEIFHWEFCRNNIFKEWSIRDEDSTRYKYFPMENIVSIDRSDYEKYGMLMGDSFDDIYDIEIISETEFWLYDIYDHINHRFRYKMQEF